MLSLDYNKIKWMTKIEKHFNRITREQFIRNLYDCGLGEIKDIKEG